jgi:hypothetical protein
MESQQRSAVDINSAAVWAKFSQYRFGMGLYPAATMRFRGMSG